MGSAFDPTAFRRPVKNPENKDGDWMGVAVKIPAETFRLQKKTVPFIPSIPLTFLQAVLPAGDSVPLLLVVLAEMRMQRATQIAIGPSIWLKAGNPSKRIRSRLLRQIEKLPASICEVVPRRGRPHLLVTGPQWPKP
jgi:hypothetical protein